MTQHTPYGTPLREYSNCSWCAWSSLEHSTKGGRVLFCYHPVISKQMSAVHDCGSQNPNGNCQYFQPSVLTKLVRILRISRRPISVPDTGSQP